MGDAAEGVRFQCRLPLWGTVCAVGMVALGVLIGLFASFAGEWLAAIVGIVLAGALSYALWRHHVGVRGSWVELGEDGVRVRDRQGNESVVGRRDIRELRVERLRWSLSMRGYSLAIARAAGPVLRIGPDVEGLPGLVSQIARRAGLTEELPVWLATIYCRPAC